MAFINKINTPEDISENSTNVLSEFKNTIDSLPPKKAEILLYWLDTWKRYLTSEDSFNYKSLPVYKRGSIIQAHLGFKVGNEQGGLHYALVVENNNAPSSGTVMAIPIRSLREGEAITDVHADEVFLGFDLFVEESKRTTKKLDLLSKAPQSNHKLIRRLRKNLTNYSKGSVAIVSQMCAVSKLRIYHPRSKNDELSGIRISNKKLDEIDLKIIQKFTKATHEKALTEIT